MKDSVTNLEAQKLRLPKQHGDLEVALKAKKLDLNNNISQLKEHLVLEKKRKENGEVASKS